MEQAARAAAGRYRGSAVAREDFEQTVWLELLKSRHTYDPALGDFFAWCWRIAISTCRRLNLEGRSPVSGCKHRPERGRLHRGEDVDGVSEETLPRPPTPEDEYREADRTYRVRKRVKELVLPEAVPFALALGEYTVEELAEHSGVSVQAVYRARRAVKNALMDDELFRIWKEES